VKALRKLIFGETWILPLGIAVLLLISGLVLKPLLGSSWSDVGGILLVVYVVGLFVIVLRRG
jgi:hypothetical protein